MIREFEDEIKRLRMQLAGEGGEMLGEDGQLADVVEEVEVQEKVVEKKVVVEKIVHVQQGRSEKEVKAMEEAMAAETQEKMSRFEAEKLDIVRKKDIAEEEKKKFIEEINKK